MDVLKTNARREAVDTLILIARNHNISDRAASIMQTWLRCAREKQLQEQLVTLLMLLMSQVAFTHLTTCLFPILDVDAICCLR